LEAAHPSGLFLFDYLDRESPAFRAAPRSGTPLPNTFLRRTAATASDRREAWSSWAIDVARLMNCFVASESDAGRDDVIRYDSPSIYGFILSTSWGDDDLWDGALRFSKQWNSVRIAAAVAYQEIDSDASIEASIGASFLLSPRHRPERIDAAGRSRQSP
jgi:hypothetical protein